MSTLSQKYQIHMGPSPGLWRCAAHLLCSRRDEPLHSQGWSQDLWGLRRQGQSAAIPWQPGRPRCRKCRQPRGPRSRWRGQRPRGGLCCFSARQRGTEQRGEHKQLSLNCRQAFNSQPRHSRCAHPAPLPADIWGSRGSVTQPILSLFHVSPTALPKQGDVALLPHMLLLLQGHSGSSTRPCTGQLKVCSAPTQPGLCRGRLGSSGSLPTDNTAASPALGGRVQGVLPRPDTADKNPCILILPLW